MAGIDLGSVYATLEMRDKGFAQAIDTAAKNAEHSFRQMNGGIQGSLNKVGDSFIGMGKTVSSAGERVSGLADTIGTPLFRVTALAGVGLGLMAKSAFGMAREVENARLNLTTFTGSAEKAEKVTKDLIAYATSNKGVLFNRAELLNSAQNMALFGVETEKLTKNVQIMSKTVALGKFDFARLDEVVGRVLATGKLAGTEFDELTKAGIKLDPSLRGASVSADELFAAMDRGVNDSVLSDRVNTIDGQMIRLSSAFQIAGAAILGLDRETGKFAKGGAGAKFMEIISNITTQLKSPEGLKSLSAIGNSIAKAFAVVIPYFQKIVEFVGNNIGLILKLYLAWAGVWAVLKVLGPVLSLIGAGMNVIGYAIKGVALGIKIIRVAQAFIALSKAVGVAKAVMLVFNVVFAANPAGVIVVAIIAIIAALVILQKKFDIFGKMKDGFMKLWEAAQPVRDFIANQLTSAFDSLKSIWSQVVTSMQPLLDAFKEFWSKHGNKVMTVLKFIAIAIGAIVLAPLIAGFALFLAGLKIVSVVLKFVADHFETIKRVVIALLAVAFAPLIIGVLLVIGAFKLLWATLQFLWSVVVLVFNAIKTAIVTVFTVIYTAIKFYVTAWLTFIKWTIALILAVIIVVFTAIWNAIRTPVMAVWNFITLAFNAIKTAITTVLNAVWAFIVAVWNRIYNTIAPIVGRLVGFLVQRWENIKANVSNAFNAVWNIIRGIWNGIRDTISNLVNSIADKVRSIKDKVTSAVSGAVNWLKDAGKDVITGFINGILSMGSDLKNKVTSFITKNLPGPVKKALGISSPSKLFAKFGRNTIQGFEKGIDQQSSSMTRTVKDTFAGLSGDVAGALGGLSPTTGSFKSGDVITDNKNLEIHGDVNIGDKQTADYFFSRLGRQNDLRQMGLVG